MALFSGKGVMSNISVDEDLWASTMAPEGIVERWFVADCAIVAKGDRVVEVRIEDALHEVSSPNSGRLSILATRNAVIEPGSVLGEVKWWGRSPLAEEAPTAFAPSLSHVDACRGEPQTAAQETLRHNPVSSIANVDCGLGECQPNGAPMDRRTECPPGMSRAAESKAADKHPDATLVPQDVFAKIIRDYYRLILFDRRRNIRREIAPAAILTSSLWGRLRPSGYRWRL